LVLVQLPLKSGLFGLLLPQEYEEVEKQEKLKTITDLKVEIEIVALALSPCATDLVYWE
jgi:hypothetical protein